MGLAIDAIRLAPKVDTVILATGDGDFEPLVEYLKNFTQVEVISLVDLLLQDFVKYVKIL